MQRCTANLFKPAKRRPQPQNIHCAYSRHTLPVNFLKPITTTIIPVHLNTLTFVTKFSNMKTSSLLVLLALITTGSFAQLKTPSPSPTQTIHQDFGLASIDLSYSRPGKKGRKVIGDLVPYGKVWRTGANNATTITFGDEVTIGGTKIAPGKYGLVTIPGKDVWTIIVTKQLDITNPAAYKKENDVVQVTATARSLKDAVETFTMAFEEVKSGSCLLTIKWENTQVELPITTEVDTKVMMQIDTAIIGKNPPYYAAAQYYFNNGKDLHKAEEWAIKATEGDPDAFYMFYQLAQIQEKLGKKAAAIATAQKSMELSKKAKNDDYVVLNEKLIARLK